MEWTGKWHPLSERFPMLDEDELREMAASITERGQYVPCRMTPEGLGLDGRNRIASCALAEVDPWWEVYEGDPIPFIVEVNAERRHLTTGQQAMAVAIGLVEMGQRKNGKFEFGSKPGPPTSARSRVSGNAWRQKVQYAGVVLDHAPELADPVLLGDLALDAAHKQADERRKERERIDALGGDLKKLVETGVIDVEEAVRRVNEEQRLTVLADDLVERFRDGSLALDEAEAIQQQRDERVVVWVEQIRDALNLLRPMAPDPIPKEIADLLATDENRELKAVLAALKRQLERTET